MIRAFTSEPLTAGTTERLLKVANRAPSAGFSQGYSFLVLEGKEQSAPLWEMLYESETSENATEDADVAQIAALSTAPLVIVPLACKDIYGHGLGSVPVEGTARDGEPRHWMRHLGSEGAGRG